MTLNYKRRDTREVNIGGIKLGATNPIRLQSMTSLSTMDTNGCVDQCARLAHAGADIVRLTAQGSREAENIGIIRQRLISQGITTPLVADIHFNPKAAFTAATTAQKVRINPGNFVDPGRTFKKLKFTEEEYAAELRRIEDTLVPFLDLCKKNRVAIRLGVNHGSLSDRIMSRYGDTPAGMVESVMEYLRVCVAHKFFDVVISIKASNVVVMVETVRLLASTMDEAGMNFPLHLGVTEAGDGEDGRIKSAVGIGCLLNDGLGDTIRVSLSEEPENEIPVASQIVEYVTTHANAPLVEETYGVSAAVKPHKSRAVGNIGGANRPVVIADSPLGDYALDDLNIQHKTIFLNTSADPASIDVSDDTIIILTTDNPNRTGAIQSWLCKAKSAGIINPVIPMIDYDTTDADLTRLHASIDFGTILLNGFADGIFIKSATLATDEQARLALSILQAARLRMTHTEFIACPSCGRTLFDLQTTLRQVKQATSHLKGLKIGVMGCIVNGPGEMADADYGYVGAAIGKVSLYKGKECVEKNIPASEAISHLISLIKESGDWVDPDTPRLQS